jgi:GNAT superfamily N-acetyltransferase
MRVVRLPADAVSLVTTIDRSEHVDVQFGVIDGRLTEQPVSISEIPPWDPVGSGKHSIAAQVDYCASLIADGAVLLGAMEKEHAFGIGVVDPSFEPRMAWLAFLHVSRPYRRQGAARALWNAAVDVALEANAESIYVSATPTGSAVCFYLGQGCHLANPVHPSLFALEPEDIHLVRLLSRLRN